MVIESLLASIAGRYCQLVQQRRPPDCIGPWLVYWCQKMPELDNKAKDDQGRPMKSWWPFLLY